MEFIKIAEEISLETAGLETVEYQMSIFDNIPYEAQAKMLVEAVIAEQDTLNDASITMDNMVMKYKEQDIGALYSLLGNDKSGLEEFEDVLLIQRNKNWIPIMIEQMLDKPTFFAVGAGHLSGPSGVLTLLKDEGYKLTPISIQKSE